jgi:hypothetical protein
MSSGLKRTFSQLMKSSGKKQNDQIELSHKKSAQKSQYKRNTNSTMVKLDMNESSHHEPILKTPSRNLMTPSVKGTSDFGESA